MRRAGYNDEIAFEGMPKIKFASDSLQQTVSDWVQRTIITDETPDIQIVDISNTPGRQFVTVQLAASDIKLRFDQPDDDDISYFVQDAKDSGALLLAYDDYDGLLLIETTCLMQHLNAENEYKLTEIGQIVHPRIETVIELSIQIGAFYSINTVDGFRLFRLLEIDENSVHVQTLTDLHATQPSIDDVINLRPSMWHLPLPIEAIFEYNFIDVAPLDDKSLQGFATYLEMAMDEDQTYRHADRIKALQWMSHQRPQLVRFTYFGTYTDRQLVSVNETPS